MIVILLQLVKVFMQIHILKLSGDRRRPSVHEVGSLVHIYLLRSYHHLSRWSKIFLVSKLFMDASLKFVDTKLILN